MLRSILWVALLVGVVPVVGGQENSSPQSPRITLTVPSDIPSETVQIRYFMAGPFGGYGNFVRTEKGKTAYNIVAAVDGKPADNVKVIAYLPGCEIATLDIPVPDTELSRSLSCTPVGRIWLHGQISPISILKVQQQADVVIDYLALWDHKFFGIMDGMVTTIRLATVVPDENGQFEAEVPDFGQQSDLGEGKFQFTLRHTNGNIIGFLKPVGEDRDSLGLKVRPSYAPVTQFLVDLR